MFSYALKGCLIDKFDKYIYWDCWVLVRLIKIH